MNLDNLMSTLIDIHWIRWNSQVFVLNLTPIYQQSVLERRLYITTKKTVTCPRSFIIWECYLIQRQQLMKEETSDNYKD